ncbi:MAG: DUF2680 domain-containing protein [Thermoanaerobacteraceae bacterium]
MLKKKIITILAVVISFVLPITVFAANVNSPALNDIKGFFGIDKSKLTTQQKDDITNYNKKIVDVEKEFVSKLLEDGLITKQQADNMIKNMDERLTKANQSNFPILFGTKDKKFLKDDFGFKKIDLSKLNEKQQSDLKVLLKQIQTIEKDAVNKLTSYGMLTQDKAKEMLSRIDQAATFIDKNGLSSKSLFEVYNGFGFIIKDINPLKLTEQQKAELTTYFKQIGDINKQIADKLASFGVITQDQKNTINSRIDRKIEQIEKNGFTHKDLKSFNRQKNHFRDFWGKVKTYQNNSGLSPQNFNNAI